MTAPIDESPLVRRLRAAGCVFAEREAELIVATFPDPHRRETAVVRRERGEPLEHVLGQAEFGGVTVALGPGCFVPRARAVALVEAAERMPTRSDAVAVDLGCGCGAVAAALTRRRPSWTVHAGDVDETALTFARRNGDRFGYSVHAGSWFSALPPSLRGKVDVVVAHLPYVPTAAIALLPRDFRDHEPVHTVDGGADGLDPLRAVVADAVEWLAPDGVLVTQVADEQVPVADSIATTGGLHAAVVPGATAGRRDAEEDVVVLALRRSEVGR